jgi:hypothetical protein
MARRIHGREMPPAVKASALGTALSWIALNRGEISRVGKGHTLGTKLIAINTRFSNITPAAVPIVVFTPVVLK